MCLPFEPAIPLVGIYPENTPPKIQKYICTILFRLFIAVLFIIFKYWKPLCPFIGEQLNKLWCIHTMEYYATVRKNKIYEPIQIALQDVLLKKERKIYPYEVILARKERDLENIHVSTHLCIKKHSRIKQKPVRLLKRIKQMWEIIPLFI